ncbi:MAG: hypothetical protein QM831_14355 [Kofleriaceae bacterium]
MGNRFISDRTTGDTSIDVSSPGSGTYEFGGAENEVFVSTSRVMKIVGVLMSVFGILIGLGAMLGKAKLELASLVQIGQAVVMVVVGGWLTSAAKSLREIADTQGQDIPNLMFAMRRLRSVYTLQAVMMGLGVILGIMLVLMASKA